MQPNIGDIVHYHSYGTPGGEYLPEARAAIITAIHTSTAPNGTDWLGQRQYADERFDQQHQEMVTDDKTASYIEGVDLCVLNPTGMFFNTWVPYSAVPKPGHWTHRPGATESVFARLGSLRMNSLVLAAQGIDVGGFIPAPVPAASSHCADCTPIEQPPIQASSLCDPANTPIKEP